MTAPPAGNTTAETARGGEFEQHIEMLRVQLRVLNEMCDKTPDNLITIWIRDAVAWAIEELRKHE